MSFLIFFISFILFFLVPISIEKKKISKKGLINRLAAAFLLASSLGIGFHTILDRRQEKIKASENIVTLSKSKKEQKKTKKEIPRLPVTAQLEVPLINQMEEPSLYNGCEVTSLAMLLKFQGIEVSKNELADNLSMVPYQDENGYFGNPNEGFVGDITGTNIGYSAYARPLIEVAEKYIGESEKVIDLTNQPFEALLQQIANNNPVWCLSTTAFSQTGDNEVWQTRSGSVTISWSVHCILITGFDEENIYLNDPYGEKRIVNRQDFEDSFLQMGQQAFTIDKL